jgi:glycosyltransferase involved in cell wall biosynthesis
VNAQLTVTAIIPVHNGEAYIENAIASVAAQTVLPQQLVVIDDGSTDGSAEAIARAQSKYGAALDITVVRQDNAGQSAARNAAAALATGDLLAFLDQDDLWHDDHLSRLTAPFETRPSLGFCYSDFDEVDGDGNWVVRRYMEAHRIEHPRKTIMQWIRSDTMVLPSATVVRRSAFEHVGGFDPTLVGYEDDDLWIRLFRAGYTSHFVARSLTVFRVHSTSSSTRASFRESRVRFFRKIAGLLPDAPEIRRYYVTDVLLPRLTRAALEEYLSSLRAGRRDEARAVAVTIDEIFDGTNSRLLRRRERWALHHPALVRLGLRWRRRLFANSLSDRMNPGRRLRDGYHEWTD